MVIHNAVKLFTILCYKEANRMKKTVLVISALVLDLAAASALPVPDTGQTACYDTGGIIACPSEGEDFFGQDGQYLTNPQSYVKLDEHGAELPEDAPWPWAMVRDSVTGLTWEIKTADGSIHDRDNTYTWSEAGAAFISILNNELFGGHADWRLPTIEELSSIIDSSIAEPGPAISADYFRNTISSGSYWSSTGSAFNSGDAWNVVFSSGSVEFSFKPGFSYYVRAVRGGQSVKRFVDNGNGTVTDIDSGLMWEVKTDDGGQRDKDNQFTWQEALSYGEGLSLAGHNDWRLPDRNELQSIVAYSRYGPSIDPVFSYTIPAFAYWSSTTDAGKTDCAWGINFFLGTALSYNKDYRYYVRAVRGGHNRSACAAEMIYGEHAHQTELLRTIRDSVLSQTPEGRQIIQVYYALAPSLVKAMETDDALRAEVKGLLDAFLSLLANPRK